jgi:hypothetical protein
MSFLIYPHKFNACHLHFGTMVQNNDVVYNNFSRIVYSTKHVSLNGVAILMELEGTQQDAHYNKVFVRFDPGHSANKTIVSQLCDIESKILSNYSGSVVGGSRRCVHLLRDQLMSGCIKVFVNDRATGANSQSKFMLKICGIWETIDECGMTCKFIKC